jgi:hypothetical protein
MWTFFIRKAPAIACAYPTEAGAKITILERMLSKPQLFIITQTLHTQETQLERRNKDIRVTWTVV